MKWFVLMSSRSNEQKFLGAAFFQKGGRLLGSF
jgi:hypothetical protein